MKYSINKQFVYIFTSLMAGTVLLCWFINGVFLESYYIKNKRNVLGQAYAKINDASTSGSIGSEEFEWEFEKICGIYNIDLIVIDPDSRMLIASGNKSKADMMRGQLLNHIFLGGDETDDVLELTKDFVILKTFDKKTGINYIEMWGGLDNGNLFLIRSALEGIRESVKIANRFLAYVGIVGSIASGIVIWLVSRRITKPILQLAQISEDMKNLNFEAKYVGNEENEIGILGEHINQLSDTLEGTISELKTANNELQNDIAQKEEIDEMRKEFLSNVSHELKTPIALIMGYAEGLKIDINDDEESRDFYCEVIMDEANKMNVMVKKLLTLNQLEFGNDTVTMERFDIVELIKNYIHSSEILIKQKEARVIFEEKESIYVWGDEFFVEEVFMNYFSNALNYVMNERLIRVTVEHSGEDKVRIGVFNTGNQIPEDSIPYIWDKFYKVDKARTREYGGSGVGLSIVKAIMKSLNQEYGIKNKINGVEFWFELDTK